ncbi:hypothetical protein SAMN06272774_3167 [Synechococcus sp. 7002]|nr:hypothetical protein SAMN06272774_3167 [Synechococcus sp. 7002]
MSRFSKLIDQLEDLDQQDLRNTAKVFAITAELYERLQQVVEAQKEPPRHKFLATRLAKTFSRNAMAATTKLTKLTNRPITLNVAAVGNTCYPR